jgi:phosphoenolpyruvate carboxykinase (ATP)
MGKTKSLAKLGLEEYGIHAPGQVLRNLSPVRLVEEAILRGEGALAQHGPLVVDTGDHTGRSPNDKFIVRQPSIEKEIWWGSVNRPIDPTCFENLLEKARQYLEGRDVFVFDGYAGADPSYRMPVRVLTEFAWHSLFAQNMFLPEKDAARMQSFSPGFVVIGVPGVLADPQRDGTTSSTFILVDLERRMALIGGTRYAGEIKKSVFSVMNYFLPRQGVLSMHCSANYGTDKNDVALLFGLSGTGKTTLSADPSRTLIGDDEHGWSDDGVFNIEGGCYAKVIRLDPQGEPEIYGTTRRFGTVLENVVYDRETRALDLDDDSLTENTRASYPLTQLHNVDVGGMAGQPKHVVFLTCDAFGVLPPISRLTEAQAMYQFLSGYTAKVAGTERGVTEPQATFSTCFGAPFMPLRPGVYAEMLGERIARHRSRVWLVNTGWTAGPSGVGHRMSLSHTRRIVAAALAGQLDEVETATDPVFGLQVPVAVEGVPQEVLSPRATWSDPAAYDAQAARLAEMFTQNFEQFADDVSAEVRAAGPRQG